MQVDNVVQAHLPTAGERARTPGLCRWVENWQMHRCTHRCRGFCGYPKATSNVTFRDCQGAWVPQRSEVDAFVVATNFGLLGRKGHTSLFVSDDFEVIMGWGVSLGPLTLA